MSCPVYTKTSPDWLSVMLDAVAPIATMPVASTPVTFFGHEVNPHAACVPVDDTVNVAPRSPTAANRVKIEIVLFTSVVHEAFDPPAGGLMTCPGDPAQIIVRKSPGAIPRPVVALTVVTVEPAPATPVQVLRGAGGH